MAAVNACFVPDEGVVTTNGATQQEQQQQQQQQQQQKPVNSSNTAEIADKGSVVNLSGNNPFHATNKISRSGT
jgi:hypothetical protein